MTPPLFSVIVPTYNREVLLRRMLLAWEQQTPRDLDFEVILVDDGSEDGTFELARDFATDRFRVIARRQENSGPARARNEAMALASGRWVLFTGDDIEPTPELLQRHLEAHEFFGSKKAAVLGRIEWGEDQEINATMRHVDGIGAEQFSFHYLVDRQPYDFRHFYTSNVSLRRDFLNREPSGFSTDFPYAAFEDAEFSYRLQGHGLQIYYWRDALAQHYHPYIASTFFARQLKCGAMAHLFWSREPQVEPLLGVGDVRRAGQKLKWRRRLGLASRRPIDLARAESAVLELGDACDPLPLVDTPRVFTPIFRYGYVSGYIDRAFEPEAAGLLKQQYLSRLFARVPQNLRRQLAREGLGESLPELDRLEDLLS